ncbi:MAG: hypothetical protein CL918_03425 [Deltaproteobacteria bacterium]|nr:hypothetical protein [Deltaproteobacteria bacterium]|tara:strand:- start:909 stop:1292 length:384 start_codon:yes stop_codon:yes gene_type:complete
MPEIKYVGASQETIDANQSRIDEYIASSTATNLEFTKTLQAQIDAASQSAEATRKQLEEDKLAAQTQLANMPETQATYAVTTTQSDPVNAKVTQKINPKKKDDNKGTLKVNRGGTANTAGSTINLGV